MPQELNNFRLIAHDTLAGFGNVGEGVSLQVAARGRRILWMAHECAPKNFTGVDVTDPRHPRVDRADRAAASQRAFQLAGGLRRPDGGRLPDRHAWRDAGGHRAVRHFQTRRAAQHRLLRLLRPAVARRAPALVRRRQDDPLLQSGAADFTPRNLLDDQFYRAIDVSDPTKPRELGRWWYPGTREGDDAPPVPRHPQFDTGWRAHNTNVYPGTSGPRLCRLYRRRRDHPRHLRHRRAEDGGALEPASAVPRLPHTADAAVRSRPAGGERRMRARREVPTGPRWSGCWTRRREDNLVCIATLPLPPVEDYAYLGGRYGAHNMQENRPGPAFHSRHVGVRHLFRRRPAGARHHQSVPAEGGRVVTCREAPAGLADDGGA